MCHEEVVGGPRDQTKMGAQRAHASFVSFPEGPEGFNFIVFTPGKINMEPENGPLEDYFPLQPHGFQVLC